MKEIGYICCFGEVLWDLLPAGKLPGGAPMNVATHLKNLGIESFVVSRVGQDSLGEDIKTFLTIKNSSLEYLQTDQNHETGVVTVALNAKKEASYEIVGPVAWDFIEPTVANNQLMGGAEAVVFGTLSCRHEVSKNTLLEFLKTPALKVYDVNFRAPHYDQNLVETLLRRANIIKMNEEESLIIAGWQTQNLIDSKEIMMFLAEKYNLKAIILTRGENGAAVLTPEGYFEFEGYKVSVADTVGSGDAFLAGFLKKYLSNESTAIALQYACALGAVVASHHGANPAIDEHDILTIMKPLCTKIERSFLP